MANDMVPKPDATFNCKCSNLGIPLLLLYQQPSLKMLCLGMHHLLQPAILFALQIDMHCSGKALVHFALAAHFDGAFARLDFPPGCIYAAKQQFAA